MKIRTLLGALILLVSGQAGAGIISGPMESANLWEYSVQGGAVDDQGNPLVVSGSMVIEMTVYDGTNNPPRLQTLELSDCDYPNGCVGVIFIRSFDLRIGDLSFFGGGPSNDPEDVSALTLNAENSVLFPDLYGYNGDWHLEGAGDFSLWFGQQVESCESRVFLCPDNLPDNLNGFFKDTPPKYIDLLSGGTADLLLTRVARVPEPSAILLFGIGLIGMIGFTKRRKAA